MLDLAPPTHHHAFSLEPIQKQLFFDTYCFLDAIHRSRGPNPSFAFEPFFVGIGLFKYFRPSFPHLAAWTSESPFTTVRSWRKTAADLDGFHSRRELMSSSDTLWFGTTGTLYGVSPVQFAPGKFSRQVRITRYFFHYLFEQIPLKHYGLWTMDYGHGDLKGEADTSNIRHIMSLSLSFCLSLVTGPQVRRQKLS